MLVPEPILIEVVELAQKAVGGELRDPDGVEYREIRRLPLGDCMRQDLMERPQRHRDQVDLKLVRSGVAEEISPRPLRDDDSNLRLIRPPREPMRIDEGSPPPMTEDDALICELRQRAADRRSADRVLVAQLVLGRQAGLRAVATAENLLEEQRLELVVDRDRLRVINRHPAELCSVLPGATASEGEAMAYKLVDWARSSFTAGRCGAFAASVDPVIVERLNAVRILPLACQRDSVAL